MATAAQIEANRRNAKKSTGPKTAGGKKKSRMNGLKHGLRSNQVVLPGESADEFNAELKGWADDWKPRNHTAAVLCERAAVATWRLRRCVRAEADLLLELADRKARRRAEAAGDDEDDDVVRDGVELAAELLDRDPAGALAELRATTRGLDWLIRAWDDLAELLGQDAWDFRDGHAVLMGLLGHLGDADPAAAGPLAVDSHRLATAHRDEDDDEDDDEERPGALSYAEEIGRAHV